jgi:hypothetical protein
MSLCFERRSPITCAGTEGSDESAISHRGELCDLSWRLMTQFESDTHSSGSPDGVCTVFGCWQSENVLAGSLSINLFHKPRHKNAFQILAVGFFRRSWCPAFTRPWHGWSRRAGQSMCLTHGHDAEVPLATDVQVVEWNTERRR